MSDKTLDPSVIRTDGGTQSRAQTSDALVIDYYEVMSVNKSYKPFPPMDVFFDGKDYWQSDGFHRQKAAIMAGLKKVDVVIHQGTRRDAVLFSCGANSIHGLRRTNLDKRRAVETLLQDEEWRKWSNIEISRRCGVSDRFVGQVRSELSPNGSEMGKRTVLRGNQTYVIDPAAIGAAKQHAQLIDGKYYPLDTATKKIYDVPFDTKAGVRNAAGFEGATVESAGNLKRQRFYREFEVVGKEGTTEADDKQSLPLELIQADKWYPVRHAEKLIYNDPFDNQAEERDEPRYYKIGCASRTGKSIVEEIRNGTHLSTYRLVDPLPPVEGKEQPEHPITPLRDASAVPGLGQIQPDKWYPMHHFNQEIYNDPFDSQAAVKSDPRYGYGYDRIMGARIIQIMPNGAYSEYKIVDPLPLPQVQEQDEDAVQGEDAPEHGVIWTVETLAHLCRVCGGRLPADDVKVCPHCGKEPPVVSTFKFIGGVYYAVNADLENGPKCIVDDPRGNASEVEEMYTGMIPQQGKALETFQVSYGGFLVLTPEQWAEMFVTAEDREEALGNILGEDEPDEEPQPSEPDQPTSTPKILVAKKYGAILVDPPWTYDNGGGRGAAGAHYSTMSASQIAGLPVADLAAEDCCLFLWATWPLLEQAFQVARAWDFEYKTIAFVWAKTNKGAEQKRIAEIDDANNWFMGMGSWTRANTEVCLLFTRGNPVRINANVRQLVIAPVGEHSVKPQIVNRRITELVGGPYLELFAREQCRGWDVWGNEVESDITFAGIEAASE